MRYLPVFDFDLSFHLFDSLQFSGGGTLTEVRMHSNIHLVHQLGLVILMHLHSLLKLLNLESYGLGCSNPIRKLHEWRSSPTLGLQPVSEDERQCDLAQEGTELGLLSTRSQERFKALGCLG